jgi:hypothetical protein
VRRAIHYFQYAFAGDVPLHFAFFESGAAPRRHVDDEILYIMLLLSFENAPDIMLPCVLFVEANREFSHGQYAAYALGYGISGTGLFKKAHSLTHRDSCES